MLPMFHSLRRKLLYRKTIHFVSPIFRFLQTQSVPNRSNLTEKQSATVSYLTSSCGLPLNSAISASKVINIRSTVKSDSVLELLRSYGLTRDHIAALVSRHPPLLLCNPDKTLRPKIEFFESKGITGDDLCKLLRSFKSILLISLKNQIIPTFDFLKRYVKTNENFCRAVKRSSDVVLCNIQKVMVPNISTLQALGVPESGIGKLIMLQPKSLMLRVDLFEEAANAVKDMGFDPTSKSFLLAVRSMAVISKQNWKKKKEALLSFGWSESDFNLAFKVQPMFMLCSEKKIRKLMHFFVNNIGFTVSDITKCPNLMLTSLEKRIIPRCSVLQVLMSKDLIKKDMDVVWVLNRNKKHFEASFMIKYMEVAPEVMNAYNGEIRFKGFNNV